MWSHPGDIPDMQGGPAHDQILHGMGLDFFTIELIECIVGRPLASKLCVLAHGPSVVIIEPLLYLLNYILGARQ